jgi:hypothetical protein
MCCDARHVTGLVLLGRCEERQDSSPLPALASAYGHHAHGRAGVRLAVAGQWKRVASGAVSAEMTRGKTYEIAAIPTFARVIRTHQPTTAVAVAASLVLATMAHPMVSRTRDQMLKTSIEVPNAMSHWDESEGR